MKLSAVVYAALAAVTTVTAAPAPSPKRPIIKYPNSKYANQHHARAALAEADPLETRYDKRWYAPAVKAPKTNIWAALSNAEAAAVIKYLHGQDALNLTAADDAGAWDNQINVVETLTVNKTDAVTYIDDDGSKPERWARVSIMFGATEEPYIQDFQVGPLPKPTTYMPLNYPTTSGVGKIRNFDADSDALYGWVYESVLAEVADIVLDLCNGTATGSENDTLDVWGIDPLWHEEGRVVSWWTFWRFDDTGFDGETLMPQGLYFKFDMTGRDPSGWGLIGWLYNDIFYKSTAEFRAAYEKPDFEKAGVHNNPGAWIGTDYQEQDTKLAYDEKAPPFAIMPSEPRFVVDYDAQWVEWMDFSFYVSFSRNTGVRLFDIKYKGKRVMYELGLEEALAHYGGNDPTQSGTAYLDTYYGFGPYAFAQVPGYDCPTYATFINSTFHVSELSKTHRNSICMFEHETDYGLQRHSTSKFVSVTKNVVFILRMSATVGNYDYQFSYTFHRDGTIEVTVRASGYIQSAYYLKNSDYGYHIHDALSGSMHDHSLIFKADVDVLGTKNTFAKHAIVPVQETYSWSNYTRSTMKLERSKIMTEDEGKLMWPANAGALYIIENQDTTNKYGEYPGWRIKPGVGSGMHVTITNSSNLFDSQNFATHHLYVTKQKDTEPHAIHENNNYNTKEPIVDFGKFFDGESLDQEDLVIWFNLGMHHVPHTGDLPNTVFPTAQSSMQFLPHNYLLRDPSRAVHHQVRLNYNDEAGVEAVKTFGGEWPSGEFDVSASNPKLWEYKGDVAVRKFPFDPAHPFNDTESIV